MAAPRRPLRYAATTAKPTSGFEFAIEVDRGGAGRSGDTDLVARPTGRQSSEIKRGLSTTHSNISRRMRGRQPMKLPAYACGTRQRDAPGPEEFRRQLGAAGESVVIHATEAGNQLSDSAPKTVIISMSFRNGISNLNSQRLFILFHASIINCDEIYDEIGLQ